MAHTAWYLEDNMKKNTIMHGFIWLLCAVFLPVQADTMEHYMKIVSNIPKMEVKADNQAQIWAKSARNVLVLTCESVAESLMIANNEASRKGASLFCLPGTVTLNSTMLHDLIQQTYRGISSQESDKEKMTVSQVALLGLVQNYPCAPVKKTKIRIQYPQPTTP